MAKTARNAKGVTQEIDSLRAELRHHEELYYVYDNPEISDVEYDALRRTIGRDKFRVLRFERLQTRQQRIVICVGNFRVVIDVVKLLVMPQLRAQRFALLRHAPFTC